MMQEAAARGHEIYAIQQEDIVLTGGKVVANSRALTLTGDSHDWYRATDRGSTALSAFGAVLMRKDPPFNMEYVYSTYLLDLAQAQGAKVFNDPRAIRDNNEKLAT